MAAYRFGDVVLVDFPFSDRPEEKRRPGLVLAQDTHGDLLVARITSKPAELPTDIALLEWRAEGLNIPSTVRLLKLATTHDSTVLRTLGRATTADRNSVITALHAFVAGLA